MATGPALPSPISMMRNPAAERSHRGAYKYHPINRLRSSSQRRSRGLPSRNFVVKGKLLEAGCGLSTPPDFSLQPWLLLLLVRLRARGSFAQLLLSLDSILHVLSPCHLLECSQHRGFSGMCTAKGIQWNVRNIGSGPSWMFYRVWRFGGRVAPDDDLAAPLLSMDPQLCTSNLGRVRRLFCWVLALLFHSVNAILYLQKRLLVDKKFVCCGLLSECSSPIISLIVCIVFLIPTGSKFSLVRDMLFAACVVAVFYLPIAMVAMVYSNSTVILEIVHIFFTIAVNILRFSSQDKIPELNCSSKKSNWFPLAVAVVGSIIGFQWLFMDLCSATKVNWEAHFAYKIASVVGAAFRFVDIFIIVVGALREKATYLLGRLHECVH